MDDIKAELRRYIEDNFIMGAVGVTLADNASFFDQHVLDSTGFLELISYLEDAFGIQVTDEEMIPENLDSLNSIDAFVARKRAA